ncbi:hypothetical protein [Rurimicrobium arvi]|uniref:Competence protein ComFB n=1 Tax=Rurimicrobium arvi TaxID=2049916 RepID=A0ABP8MY36_9BACT
MKNLTDLAIYQSYSALLAKYQRAYDAMEQNYNLCGCRRCKQELFKFGLDLLALKTFVDHIENNIAPELTNILNLLQVEFLVSDNGTTELKNRK